MPKFASDLSRKDVTFLHNGYNFTGIGNLWLKCHYDCFNTYTYIQCICRQAYLVVLSGAFTILVWNVQKMEQNVTTFMASGSFMYVFSCKMLEWLACHTCIPRIACQCMSSNMHEFINLNRSLKYKTLQVLFL